jgi:hypothetical protein
MTFLRCVPILMCTALLATPSFAADVVTLTNGDRLTGQVKSASGSSLEVETDALGTVRIKRSSVAQVTRTGADGRAQVLSAADITRLGSAIATASQSPSWNAAANGDLALSRGNSDTATLSVNGAATRAGGGSRFDTYANYLLTTVGSGTGTTLARAVRSGARLDRDVARPLYVFGFGDIEHDFLQLLDLRTVVGGGAGLHVANRPRVQANVFGGVSYARDSYAAVVTDPATTPTTTTTTTTETTPTGGSPNANANGRALAVGRNRTIVVETRTPPEVVNETLSRSVGEYVFGQDLYTQLSDTTSLTQRFVLFPAIADPGDFRISLDLTLTSQMSERWQWHTTVSDRYLRIPPAGGAVRNDLFVATGIGLTFGRGDVGGYRGADTRGR